MSDHTSFAVADETFGAPGVPPYLPDRAKLVAVLVRSRAVLRLFADANRETAPEFAARADAAAAEIDGVLRGDGPSNGGGFDPAAAGFILRSVTLRVPTYRDDLPRALHILRGENGGYVVTDAALPRDIVLAAVSDGRELVRWLTEAPTEGGEDAQ